MVRQGDQEAGCIVTDMNMVRVESSMILSVGYDAGKKTMCVLFASGRTYNYQGVPAAVHKELMDSASKGSYMNGNVIECYPTSQMKGRGRS